MGSEVTDNRITHERTSWAALETSTCVKVFVVAALLCWFFQEELIRTVNLWFDDASWSHGLLIPLFSLYFVNQRKKEILNLETRGNYLGLALLLCCFVFYWLDVAFFQVYYLQALTFIAATACVVLFLGGWKLIRYTWLPILYLAFAVKVPDRLYKELTDPMRILAARIASALLSLVRGLESQANGVVIDVTYHGKHMDPPLDVAEACSGMRLLMAFLALGVAMAYLHYRPVWQRLILLASTIPIAILCNIVRVTVTGFIYVLWSPRYAQGIYHDLLGMAMLPLAFGLYGAIAWFMSNLIVEDEAGPTEDIIVRTGT
jgi:exosortase